MSSPASMLDSPRKRSCPSVIRIARSKTRRHEVGLTKGRIPSTTSISAQAASSESQKSAGPKAAYFFGEAGAAGVGGPMRIALKKSLFGSTTNTSALLRKLARNASKVR